MTIFTHYFVLCEYFDGEYEFIFEIFAFVEKAYNPIFCKFFLQDLKMSFFEVENLGKSFVYEIEV